MPTPATIAAQAGRLFALYMGSGTSPETYTLVTGLRASDITLNGNPVDITTKSSGGWRELLPGAGITQIDFTGSGVYDANSEHLVSMQQAVMNSPNSPVYINAKVQSAAGDSYEGWWAVESFKRSGSHNDAEMFDVTLRSHGQMTYNEGM